MHLHEFLAKVHEVVEPAVYLEVGVQHGTSLNLAHAASLAIGVDPFPLVAATGNQRIAALPSDQYFEQFNVVQELLPFPPIDLGFIDGLHHFEQALRDFVNIEKFCHQRSIVIFDDVLPRNQAEASRTECPGDWTGDVWKISKILRRYRPDLVILEVNTQPTGTLMVWAFGAKLEGSHNLERVDTQEYLAMDEVPENVINRGYAVAPEFALKMVKEFLAS